jgi:hypothetical protein
MLLRLASWVRRRGDSLSTKTKKKLKKKYFKKKSPRTPFDGDGFVKGMVRRRGWSGDEAGEGVEYEAKYELPLEAGAMRCAAASSRDMREWQGVWCPRFKRGERTGVLMLRWLDKIYLGVGMVGRGLVGWYSSEAEVRAAYGSMRGRSAIPGLAVLHTCFDTSHLLSQ